MTEIRSRRKEKIGVVIAHKMAKTVTVQVNRKMRHSKYEKVVERAQKFLAHDETDAIAVGKKVRMVETRPLSKLKRWRVVEVL